jgi:hypothetical protein
LTQTTGWAACVFALLLGLALPLGALLEPGLLLGLGLGGGLDGAAEATAFPPTSRAAARPATVADIRAKREGPAAVMCVLLDGANRPGNEPV